MRELTPRLQRRVRRDYPVDAEFVLATLGDLDVLWGAHKPTERVLAAILLAAGGDLARLGSMVEQACLDWRDALTTAGLAGSDWSLRLDAELGPQD